MLHLMMNMYLVIHVQSDRIVEIRMSFTQVLSEADATCGLCSNGPNMHGDMRSVCSIVARVVHM